MKKTILTIIFTVLFSNKALSGEKVLCNTDEPRYHVKVFVEAEGLLIKEHVGEKVKIFTSPSDDSLLMSTFTVTKNLEDYRGFYSSFSKKKNIDGSRLVSSTERKGDFYKVCYKGKDAWVKKGGIVVVYNLEEYFKEIGSFFEVSLDRKSPFYKEIQGEEIPFPEIKDRIHSSFKEFGILGEPVGFKELNGKFWLRLKISPESYVVVENKEMENNPFKPFHFWIRPYDDQGEIDGWSFPYNDVKFYKTNKGD